MKFCSACGRSVSLRIPAGDHLPRHVCDACDAIHYQNPRLIVGCVPEYRGRILLCRRAIEPRHGFWTIPAGFMENGESLQAGAARESMEEAMAHVAIGSLLAIVHVLHADQVHVMFRAQLVDSAVGAGSESLEVRLFDPSGIPWDALAFRSVDFALRKYLEDRHAGVEGLHYLDIDLGRSG